jgi:hypothetical protein
LYHLGLLHYEQPHNSLPTFTWLYIFFIAMLLLIDTLKCYLLLSYALNYLAVISIFCYYSSLCYVLFLFDLLLIVVTNTPSPPTSKTVSKNVWIAIPITAGLRCVKLHPRKSSIKPFSTNCNPAAHWGGCQATSGQCRHPPLWNFTSLGLPFSKYSAILAKSLPNKFPAKFH